MSSTTTTTTNIAASSNRKKKKEEEEERPNKKLYGRQDEVDTLRQVLLSTGSDANHKGTKRKKNTRTVLVHGVSGSGKTHLIRKAYDPGYNSRKKPQQQYGYGYAKFGQHESGPFATVAECLRQLLPQQQEDGETMDDNSQEYDDDGTNKAWRSQVTDMIRSNPTLTAFLWREGNASSDPDGKEKPITNHNHDDHQHPIWNGMMERLKYSVRNLVRKLCQQGKSIVMVFDDIQWAQAESLQLLQYLMEDDKRNNTFDKEGTSDNYVGNDDDDDEQAKEVFHPLVVVLAYRSPGSETSTTSFDAFLQSMQPHIATQVHVSPLSIEATTDWLVDVLDYRRGFENVRSKSVEELVNVILQKTGGNAFYVEAFVTALRQRGLLYQVQDWNHPTGQRWMWNLRDVVEKMSIQDNLLQLVHDKFTSTDIPPTVRTLCQAAALLRLPYFDVSILLLACQELQKHQTTTAGKNDATVAHILMTQEDVQAALDHATQEGFMDMIYVWKYKFSHDKLEESALEMLTMTLVKDGTSNNVPETANHTNLLGQVYHDLAWRILDVARTTMGTSDLQDRKDKYTMLSTNLLREAVPLLLQSSSLSFTERIAIAEVHVETAQIYMNRSAFPSACTHLEFCIHDLLQNDWNHHDAKYHQLLIRASTLQAQAYLASGSKSDEECMAIVDRVIARGRTLDDTLEAYDALVHLLTVQSRFQEALEVCILVLGKLGVRLPRRNQLFHVLKGIISLKRSLKQKSDYDLLNLPEMTDPHMIRALRLLSQVVEAAFFAVQPMYLALAVIHQLNICWTHGSCSQTSEAYCHGAMLFGQTGDFELAYRFGQLGYTLARIKQQSVPSTASIHDGLAIFVHYYFINHWQRPYNESLNPMMEAHQLMISCGGFHKAWYPLIAYALLYYCCGLSLEPMARDLQKYHAVMRDCGQTMHIQHTLPLQQMVMNFMGKNQNPLLLTGDAMVEEDFLKEVEEVPRAKNEYVRCKMILAYYFGDMELAFEMSKRMPSADVEGSVAMLPIHVFLQGLIGFAMARKTRKESRFHRRKALSCTNQMRTWVKKGNPNCHHLLLLMEAELQGLMDVMDTKSSRSRFFLRRRAREVRATTIRKYDDAVASAGRSGFLHHHALANERAADYCLRNGDQGMATAYLKRARLLYIEYGAAAKANHINEVFESTEFQVAAGQRPISSSSVYAKERLSVSVPSRDGRSQTTSRSSLLFGQGALDEGNPLLLDVTTKTPEDDTSSTSYHYYSPLVPKKDKILTSNPRLLPSTSVSTLS